MGDLPQDRIVPSRTFEKDGLDYAGPITTKPNFKRSRDSNTKPLDWPMKSILEVFLGSDDLVRVVKIKTSSGILKELSPLPIPDDPAVVEQNI
ncbi:hypothetical protein TNIN_80101 [Trichonephila inaurata madagascariensis]|uniref:DUF5641 domain-containing protein n=1 Tax=Trichonephila inaurata madagascariensis TaxID=2747483 RepID=A0A8X7BR10_9ARAC|nr:hypothetical protein TNIN_80101 [Trichonephila inaurata madagascariensis]